MEENQRIVINSEEFEIKAIHPHDVVVLFPDGQEDTLRYRQNAAGDWHWEFESRIDLMFALLLGQQYSLIIKLTGA